MGGVELEEGLGRGGGAGFDSERLVGEGVVGLGDSAFDKRVCHSGKDEGPAEEQWRSSHAVKLDEGLDRYVDRLELGRVVDVVGLEGAFGR